jgi:DnaJ homolog subfamily C member 9
VITSESIEKFSKQYKGSDEEKDDVLAAYDKFKGRWDRIYATVMLSEPLDDEERYRGWIDEAIESGDVEGYKAYMEETERQKEARMKQAKKMKEREGKEAMAHAEKLGVKDKLFGNGKKKESSEDALATLIRSRQVGRGNFLDALEEKYAAKEKKAKKGKKRGSEDEDEDGGMPSEEAFQAAAARLKGGKNGGEASEGRKAKRAKR